jgi:hypothetical protein
MKRLVAVAALLAVAACSKTSDNGNAMKADSSAATPEVAPSPAVDTSMKKDTTMKMNMDTGMKAAPDSGMGAKKKKKSSM